MSYTSIFDGQTLITKKELCGILNLDLSRPGLKFSANEIQKAYRQRALRFHPDTQRNKKPPIPTNICNILMNDIVLARDYMLKGEDNIPGKAFTENSKKSFLGESSEWIDIFINTLNAIKSGTSTISSTIPWISRLSHNFFIVPLLSTFSNNQLNFRYVNVFSQKLHIIRPFLKGIDGSYLVSFLLYLKEALNSTHEEDILAVEKRLKEKLPQDITKNKKFGILLVAIKGVKKELKEMLTDNFIDHIKHIVQFWPNFIATVPSWRHILGVYFISLLFTSSSLPKYFRAVKTITEVIWKQKGAYGLILSSLPLAMLTVALLPLNISIQLSAQFAWIALRASFQILINSIRLLFSIINIFRSLFNKDISLAQNAVILLESTLNLTVRLAVNIIMEILDGLIFILSNKSMLSSFQSAFNNRLDSIIDSLRPKKASKGELTLALITPTQDKIEEPSLKQEKPKQTFAFFENGDLRLHNEEDLWLKQLLASLPVEDQANETNKSSSTTFAM